MLNDKVAVVTGSARTQNDGISPEGAKLRLLSEKQPSKAFVTPEQLGPFIAGAGQRRLIAELRRARGPGQIVLGS